MSRAPRVTGPDLIAALAKTVSAFCASKAAIISCAMRMGEARLCPRTRARRIGPGLLRKILRDCQLTANQLSELL